jgi:hypothetical protein
MKTQLFIYIQNKDGSLKPVNKFDIRLCMLIYNYLFDQVLSFNKDLSVIVGIPKDTNVEKINKLHIDHKYTTDELKTMIHNFDYMFKHKTGHIFSKAVHEYTLSEDYNPLFVLIGCQEYIKYYYIGCCYKNESDITIHNYIIKKFEKFNVNNLHDLVLTPITYIDLYDDVTGIYVEEDDYDHYDSDKIKSILYVDHYAKYLQKHKADKNISKLLGKMLL